MKKGIRKSMFLVGMLGALTLVGCGEAKEKIEDKAAPTVTGTLQVAVLDVGKADCILFQTEQHNFMIDTAEKNNGKDIIKELQARGIEHLDFVELSHYDKDHIGGLRKLLDKGITVDTIYAADYACDSKDYRKTLEALEENNQELTIVKDKVELTMDDVLVEIYPAMKEDYSKGNANRFEDEETDNEFSLATMVKHGTNKMLFAGDACNERLPELSKQMNVESTFLKVPHHGRADDYTRQFLKDVNPQYAVITCSAKNMPDEAVVSNLKDVGATVYETENGRVDCVSDGKTLTINQIAE